MLLTTLRFVQTIATLRQVFFFRLSTWLLMMKQFCNKPQKHTNLQSSVTTGFAQASQDDVLNLSEYEYARCRFSQYCSGKAAPAA